MLVRRTLGLVVLFLLTTWSTGRAQLPSPALDRVFPTGAQVGTTVELEIAGRDLDEATRLVLFPTGLEAERIKRETHEFETGLHYVPNRFRLTVPTNMPLGVYDVRIVGRFGASTPASFVIGDVPELVENGDNHQPDKAIELPLDQVMNGRADGGVIDYYRIHAEAGQTLVVECVAAAIESKLRPVITVWDAAGKQLARNRHLSEPIVTLKAESAGDYLIGVNDHVYAGGATHPYRLRVYTGPYVMAVMPSAALPGSAQTFTLLGHNLPGGSGSTLSFEGRQLENSTVSLLVPTRNVAAGQGRSVITPVTAQADGFMLRVGGTPASNGLFVPFAEYPLDPEADSMDNGLPDSADFLSAVPAEVAGRFFPRRDQDWFRFQARAGQTYQVRVLSHRLGHPTDPEIFIQKITPTDDGQEKAAQVSTDDDFRAARDRYRLGLRRGLDLTHRDPSVRFTADQSGEYRVGLRDLNGSSIDDPRLTYRLIIEPVRGDFDLLAWGQSQGADDDKKIDRAPLVLRYYGVLPVMIDVLRRGGFDGPVRVTAENLPDGVTASPCVVQAGEIEGVLLLQASVDAEPYVGPIQIVGEAIVEGKSLRREAREVTLTSATGNIEQSRPAARLAREMILSVIRSDSALGTVDIPATADLPRLRDARQASAISTVSLAEANAPLWQTCVGGKLSVPLKLARHGLEFKSDLTLNPLGLPDKCKATATAIKPDGSDATLDLTLDAADIKPGLYTVFLRGAAKVGYSRNPTGQMGAEHERKNFDKVLAQLQADVDAAATKVADAKSSIAGRAEQLAKLEAARSQVEQHLTAANEQLKALGEPLAALAQAEAVAPESAAELKSVVAQFQSALQQANEALAAIQQGAAAIQTKLAAVQAEMKSVEEAVVAAENAHQQATQKLARAQEYVKQLDANVAETTKTFAVADVNTFIESGAFYVEILPTPIELTPSTETIEVKRGATVELPLSVARKFGFADAVTVTPELPNGVKLQAAPVTITADSVQATLNLTVAEDATVGSVPVTLRSNLKFNGVDLVDKNNLTVNIQ
ncbi:MAG: hypothetical protein KDA92_05235 [Planctomycetales bacterium]|nr:hypothetical protein [Planctomycetales bacterium]